MGVINKVGLLGILRGFSSSRPPIPSSNNALRRARYALALSMGAGKGNAPEHANPGRSNEDIAKLVNWGYWNYGQNWKVIAQFEIYDLLHEIPKEHKIRIHSHSKRKQNGTREYLDTHEVNGQAMWHIQKNGGIMEGGIETYPVALFAHPHHWLRCARDAAGFGMDPIAPPGLNQIRYWFGSSQRWTKTRLFFLPYNELANGIYAERGYYGKK